MAQSALGLAVRLRQLGSADPVMLPHPIPVLKIGEGQDEARVVERMALGGRHGAPEVVKELALGLVVVASRRRPHQAVLEARERLDPVAAGVRERSPRGVP